MQPDRNKEKPMAKRPEPTILEIPENLNIKQAAERLGCTVHWLRLEVKAGNISPLTLGHKYVFPIEEILRYRSQVAQDAGCLAAVR